MKLQKSLQDYNRVLIKLQYRLFSFGGKLVLIRHVLSSMSLHLFHVLGRLLQSFRSLRGYLPDSYGVIRILGSAFIGANGHLSVFQWRRVVLEFVPFLIWPMLSRWSDGGDYGTNTHFGLLSWNLNIVELSIQVWFNFAILHLFCGEDYDLFVVLLNLIFVDWLDWVIVVSGMIASLNLRLSFILILQ